MSTTIQIKDVKTFTDMLANATAATSKKTDSVFAGVILHAKNNEVLLRGTDGDITIVLDRRDITEVDGEVSFVAPAKLFTEIMKKLPKGEVSIQVEEGKVSINVNKSSYGLSTMDESQMPEYDESKIDMTFEVNGRLFSEGLSQVLHATSESEARPILNGVHMMGNSKYITLIATDSHRVMATGIPFHANPETFSNIVIPKHATKELIRILSDVESATISVSSSLMRVHYEGLAFTTRLLEGTYPNIDKVFPETFESTCVLNREELLQALDRAKTILGSEKKVAKFTFQAGTLPTLSIQCSTSITKTNDELFATEITKEIELNLNVYFLQDTLRSISTKDVWFGMAGQRKPILIKPVAEKQAAQIGLLLPVI